MVSKTRIFASYFSRQTSHPHFSLARQDSHVHDVSFKQSILDESASFHMSSDLLKAQTAVTAFKNEKNRNDKRSGFNQHDPLF